MAGKSSHLVDLNDLETFYSSGQVTNLSRSYFLEMEVIDDPVTGFPEITSRLYEEEGGAQLLEVSFTDMNAYGIPPYTSGTAGVWAWASQGALNVTFDDVRAVPEPSTLLLLSIGAVGLVAFARRRRKRAA